MIVRQFLPVLIVWCLLPAAVSAQRSESAESEAIPRWTVNAGIGSSRAWNFVGVSQDVLRAEGFSLYWTAGFGTILVGGGVAYHSNRDGHGVVFSGTAGLAGAHASAALQVRLRERIYASAGLSAGSYFLQHSGLLPILALEYRY